MKYAVLFILIAAASVHSAYMPAEPKTRLDPARVLVMYDATYTGDEDLNGVQDSLQLAQFYVAARSIPEANLFPVNWTNNDGDFTLAEFKESWLAPLLQFLDSVGPTTIDVFAVLWPLPSGYSAVNRGVSIDATLMRPYEYYSGAYTPQTTYGASNPYYFPNPTFRPDIARFSHATNGLDKSYLVSRIDGPGGLMQKFNMIANAIYADKYVNTDAFFGTAYVDSRGLSSSTNFSDYIGLSGVSTGSAWTHAEADYGIAYGASYFANRSLPYKWENTGGLIGMMDGTFVDGTPSTTAPRAMFYFGWYSYGVYYDVYDWLPGSYASDLDSINFGYSYRNHYWSVFGTQSLYHGATTAMGCLGEPYTAGHPRTPVPAYMLLQGYSWAEAATASTPCLAWNSIGFGDPLYQPFADKELLVDTDAPQPGSVSIVYNNRTGVAVAFSLQGVESAKLTLWYGVVSPRENFVKSRHFQTHFRQPFPDLQGSTTYKYILELEDPVGNKFVSEEYSFTTIAQEPYYGTPQFVPGEMFCASFDYGGEGIASHDLVGNGYVWIRTDSGMQVAHYDENFIFDIYNGEWMKWTIHANVTGRYLFEVKHKASAESARMAILIFVDGVQVLQPYNCTAADNVYVSLGSFILAEGDHVIKLKVVQTSGTYPYAFPDKAGEFRRIKFTLEEELSDTTAPVIDVLSSTSDSTSFIEHVSFSDDTGVSHVKVHFNGESSVRNTITRLDENGAFTFYFDKTSTFNVTIVAFDFFDHSSSHYFYYQDEPEPVPPNVIVAPDGTIVPREPIASFSSASIITLAGPFVFVLLFL